MFNTYISPPNVSNNIHMNLNPLKESMLGVKDEIKKGFLSIKDGFLLVNNMNIRMSMIYSISDIVDNSFKIKTEHEEILVSEQDDLDTLRAYNIIARELGLSLKGILCPDCGDNMHKFKFSNPSLDHHVFRSLVNDFAHEWTGKERRDRIESVCPVCRREFMTYYTTKLPIRYETFSRDNEDITVIWEDGLSFDLSGDNTLYDFFRKHSIRNNKNRIKLFQWAHYIDTESSVDLKRKLV